MAASLIPFPGPRPPWLCAGVTPPRGDDGSPLDLRHPDEDVLIELAGPEGTARRAAWTSQMHGTRVLVLDSESGQLGEADGMATDAPGLLLATRHADCPPVLLWDEARPAIALVHSGRKGTFANIAARAVAQLRGAYGSEPSHLAASLGPGIRACCYEVGDDVIAEAPPAAEPYLQRCDGRIYVDLQAMIAAQLHAAGVGRVYGANAECTCCSPTGFHSYRRDRTTLRFAALAVIRLR